ncbi:MAG: FAD/NAD(P)-binding protein [Candidatus Atabeyarchaeum deiterrae]
MKADFKPEKVTVKDIKDQTRDVRTFTMSFTNGKTPSSYSFLPGQFNMLSLLGFGEAAISISSDPKNRETIDHTVRNVGNLTSGLFRLKKGDYIGLRGPFGKPWPIEEAKGKNVLIVAGGVGLAPLRSVVMHVANNRANYGNFEILYGARNPGEMLFTDEFDQWRKIKNTNFQLTVDAVPPSEKWNHTVGVVTVLFDKMQSQPKDTIVMTCGPEIMMHFAVQGLIKKGFPEDQIYVSLERRMKCGMAQCGACQIGPNFVCKDGPVFKSPIMKALYA